MTLSIWNEKQIKSNKLKVSFTFIISETIKSTENQLVSQQKDEKKKGEGCRSCANTTYIIRPIFSVSFSGIVLHLQISYPSNIMLNRVEMVVIGANRVKLCLAIVTTKEPGRFPVFCNSSHLYPHLYRKMPRNSVYLRSKTFSCLILVTYRLM